MKFQKYIFNPGGKDAPKTAGVLYAPFVHRHTGVFEYIPDYDVSNLKKDMLVFLTGVNDMFVFLTNDMLVF